MSEGDYTYEPGENGYYRIRKPDGTIALPHHLCRTLNSSRLKKFRKFIVREGNLVVVQHPEGMQEPSFANVLQQFAEEMVYRTGVSALWVAVNRLSDMTVLDEERMDTYGWVKKSRVLMFKEDKWDTQEPDEEE